MQEISPIKNRILQYLEYKGVSKYKFYVESRITRGVLDKDSGISEDNIAKFIAYEPNINLEWLLTGKGEMFRQQVDSVMDSQDRYIIDSPNTIRDQLIATQQDLIDNLKEQNSSLKEEVKKLKKSLKSKECKNGDDYRRHDAAPPEKLKLK